MSNPDTVFRFRFDEHDMKGAHQNCIVKRRRQALVDQTQRTFLVQLMTKHAIVSTSSRTRRTNNRHVRFLLNMTRRAISTACSRVGTTPHMSHYYFGASRPIS
jgi:hypothetical protein